MTKLGRTKRGARREREGATADAGVLRLAREQADPAELRAAFDRYRAAAVHVASDAPASPALIEARMVLTRLLVRDGWEPPASVLEQLSKDEEFLRHPLSSVG